MEENQIIFEDAKEASEHINDIWNNPLSWWLKKMFKKLEVSF